MKILKCKLIEGSLERYRRACGACIGRDESNPDIKQLLLEEHSPIRCIQFEVLVEWRRSVAVHIVRHATVGQLHFMESRRPDRSKKPRTEDTIVRHYMILNAQHLITISRDRLCYKNAEDHTRKAWTALINAVAKQLPVMKEFMNPDCIYRGKCHNKNSCGFYKSLKDLFMEETVFYDIGDAISLLENGHIESAIEVLKGVGVKNG